MGSTDGKRGGPKMCAQCGVMAFRISLCSLFLGILNSIVCALFYPCVTPGPRVTEPSPARFRSCCRVLATLCPCRSPPGMPKGMCVCWFVSGITSISLSGLQAPREWKTLLGVGRRRAVGDGFGEGDSAAHPDRFPPLILRRVWC